MHFGMEGLYAAIQHLGKPSEFGYVFHGNARVAQQLGGATGGDEFYAHAGQLAGKVHQSGLIGDTENGSFDPGHGNL